MSYRSGHHSTSDDSSRYRTAAEMSAWRARDPVARFQRHLASRGWWDDDRERQLRVAARKEVGAGPARRTPLENPYEMLITEIAVYFRIYVLVKEWCWRVCAGRCAVWPSCGASTLSML